MSFLNFLKDYDLENHYNTKCIQKLYKNPKLL